MLHKPPHSLTCVEKLSRDEDIEVMRRSCPFPFQKPHLTIITIFKFIFIQCTRWNIVWLFFNPMFCSRYINFSRLRCLLTSNKLARCECYQGYNVRAKKKKNGIAKKIFKYQKFYGHYYLFIFSFFLHSSYFVSSSAIIPNDLFFPSSFLSFIWQEKQSRILPFSSRWTVLRWMFQLFGVRALSKWLYLKGNNYKECKKRLVWNSRASGGKSFFCLSLLPKSYFVFA